MVHLISGGEPGRAVEMSVTPARPGATVPCAERGTQKETRCRTGRLVGHRDGRGDGECGHHHDRPRALPARRAWTGRTSRSTAHH